MVLIRRQDIVTSDGITPETGVYVTVTLNGEVAPIFEDDGTAKDNPFVVESDGSFQYNVEVPGAYEEEYRLDPLSAPRTVVAIAIGMGSDAASIFASEQAIAAAASASNAEAAAASAATREAETATIAANAVATSTAIQAQINGFPGGAGQTIPVATRAVAKAISSPAGSFYLYEAGREGNLIVIDYAANAAAVDADTEERIYFRSSATPASAFQRVTQGVLDLPMTGAVGDGVADDASHIAAAKGVPIRLANRTYASNQASVSVTQQIFGPGKLMTTVADRSAIKFSDQTNVNTIIDGIIVAFVSGGPMPDASGDDFSLFNFGATRGALMIGGRIDSPWTGIRSSYMIGGVQNEGLRLIAPYIRNARNMGIECINSKYDLGIGVIIENGGVICGTHGIRWATNLGLGFSYGRVFSGGIIRDRGTVGLSIQTNCTHSIFSNYYVENTTGAGIGTSASSGWAGYHILGPNILKNTGAEGWDLDFISSCFVAGISDHAGDFGLRTDATASLGHHLITAILANGVTTAASIRSDNNLAILIVDNNAAGTPVSIAGSNNLVIVVVTSSITNQVKIDGNNNVVIMVENGTGSTGLTITGSRNDVSGRVKGSISFSGTGSNNTLNVNCDGFLALAAGNANNMIMGNVGGTISDSGTNNNLSRILGGRPSGSTTATTSASGTITVTHGAKKTPKQVFAALNMDAAYRIAITAKTSTTFVAKFFDAAGAALASTSVTFDWEAKI